MEKRLFQKQK